MKRSLSVLAGLTAALFALPALAFHCPQDMKAIDEALAAKPALEEAAMKEVMSLRAAGEEHHKAGRHAESVEVLGRALSLLKMGGEGGMMDNKGKGEMMDNKGKGEMMDNKGKMMDDKGEMMDDKGKGKMMDQ